MFLLTDGFLPNIIINNSTINTTDSLKWNSSQITQNIKGSPIVTSDDNYNYLNDSSLHESGIKAMSVRTVNRSLLCNNLRTDKIEKSVHSANKDNLHLQNYFNNFDLLINTYNSIILLEMSQNNTNDIITTNANIYNY
jgi:hypothetical protein